MRNFLQFLFRNHVLILFIILEVSSFWLIFSNNLYHNTYFINTANSVSGDVLNTYGNLTNYFYLKQVNDSLMLENISLREQLGLKTIQDSTQIISVNDSTGELLYSYIPALVINNSFTEPNNYITLNKGAKDGIKKDMGVITSNGVVGIVKSVSENYSVVLSVLHGDYSTRVAVKRNNAQGRLQWVYGNPKMASVVDVSEPGMLYEGDSIVTTEFSMVYPPDHLVGILKTFGREAGSVFYTLDVQLSTNFSTLKYVYVVNFLRKNERQQLETQATHDSN
ncbi:MAG: rod shape-determining protein MreC [Bacteroidetes bacterium]|nr:rod shape-determining protein MreC [Bacteroidota bacterium]